LALAALRFNLSVNADDDYIDEDDDGKDGADVFQESQSRCERGHRTKQREYKCSYSFKNLDIFLQTAGNVS
jgi:hypothetical protein